MKSGIKKGMVLAAGLGTRLAPITRETPKPLVPVLNVPNILHSLHLLKRSGINEIILNLHHLPDQLESYLGDGKRWGLRLAYSRETQLLGTGGGLKRAEKFFDGGPLVLANCDFISNVDLSPIIERHLERKALGTMVLYLNAELQPLYSKVGADDKGNLCALPRLETRAPARTGIFTGIHLLDNSVFSYLKEVPCGINEILYPALMKERPDTVFAEFMKGYWHDTGDLPAFFAASMRMLDQLEEGGALSEFMSGFGGYEESSTGVWLPKGVALPTGIEVAAPVVIGRDCRFGKGVKLGPHTVLGDGADIGDKARLSRFVGLGRPRIDANQTCDGVVRFQRADLPLKLPTK